MVNTNNSTFTVRNKANSKIALASFRILKRRDTFQAVAVVTRENVGGNNLWFKNAKGNYVWSGKLIRI